MAIDTTTEQKGQRPQIPITEIIGRLYIIWSPIQSIIRRQLKSKLSSKSIEITDSTGMNIFYSVGSLMTPIVLVKLQNTPLCLLLCFISDSTSRYFSLSLQWALALRYLASERSFDVFSFRRLASNWLNYSRLTLLTCNLSLVVEIHLLKQIYPYPAVA
jgi:hypothetical protein